MALQLQFQIPGTTLRALLKPVFLNEFPWTILSLMRITDVRKNSFERVLPLATCHWTAYSSILHFKIPTGHISTLKLGQQGLAGVLCYIRDRQTQVHTQYSSRHLGSRLKNALTGCLARFLCFRFTFCDFHPRLATLSGSTCCSPLSGTSAVSS